MAMKPTMEISLEDIPREGLELDFEGDAVSLGLEGDEMGFDGPVAITARLDRAETTVNATGTLSARVRLQCGRCGKDVQFPVRSDFQTAFKRLSKFPPDEEARLTKTDLDVIFYEGGLISLAHLVREQILLATPMRPLCSPGCKGLCPKCGQDLNLGACGCPIVGSPAGRWLFDQLRRA